MNLGMRNSPLENVAPGKACLRRGLRRTHRDPAVVIAQPDCCELPWRKISAQPTFISIDRGALQQ